MKEKGKLIQDDLIHFSLVEDDGSALCWEGDACPEVPPIISTEIREVTCTECQKHYDTLNDLNRALGEKGKLIESPESLVPSHGAAEIGAGAENTAGVRDLTIRTPMPPTNCWCSNDSATCKECWPERAESPWQPSADERAEFEKAFPVLMSDSSDRPMLAWHVWQVARAELMEVSQHPVPAPNSHEIYEKCARIAESYYWNCSDKTCPGCMTAKDIAEHIREAEHYSGQLAPNTFPEPKAEYEHPERATKSTQCTCEKCKGEHPVPAPETQTQGDNAELVRMAEKLLEWMPIYSKGSSGHIRQMNLRAAIDKLKAEPVEYPSSPPSQMEREIAKLLHIEYCEDLAEEGTPWEVPAEPEPSYFATLKEAIEFHESLPEDSSSPQVTPPNECICEGNWRNIVKETAPLIGKGFLDNRGREYRLFGIVHGDDDYYYGMCSKEHGMILLTCVGNLTSHEFRPVGSEVKPRTGEPSDYEQCSNGGFTESD